MKRQKGDAFTNELLGLLLRMIRKISQRETHPLARGQVTLPQFLILESLYECQPKKLKELSGVLKVTPSAVTGIVERMERDKLLKRRPDMEDRRIHWLWLTPKGRSIVLSVLKQKEKSIRFMFACLTKSEKVTYLKLFKKVVAATLT